MNVRIIFLLILFSVGQRISEAETPSFVKSSCPFSENLEGVECGFVTVPENRDRPDTRRLRLSVAILRSTNPSPAPDPLVFLSGGPGEKSVEYIPVRAKRPFWIKLRENRDLIFFDQRGTGYSEPAFCPELFEVYTAGFRGLSFMEQIDFQKSKLAGCRDQLLKQGLDFSAYNSRTSVLDLEDIRKALGYEHWNLFGLSYGTRLALTAMRDTPKGIRSVILDSTSPPNVQNWIDMPANYSRSLRVLFDNCERDVECKQKFSNLEKDYYEVMQNLEQNPIVITELDARFPDGKLVLDGTLFAAGIFQGLYDSRFIRLIPMFIHEMKKRNENVLKAVAEGLVRNQDDMSVGLQLAVDCYELAPFNPQLEVEAAEKKFPDLRLFHEFTTDHAICDAWHDVRADAAESLPVYSEIPTLILAGEFDPITPPGYGKVAASTLRASTFVEIPAVGHGVSGSSECTRSLHSRFLADPTNPLDTRCVQHLKPITFRTDLDVNPAVYGILSRFAPDSKPGLIAAVVFTFLFLISVIVWPVAYVKRSIRNTRSGFTQGQKNARWIAAIASLIAISFIILFSIQVAKITADNPYILAFGLPQKASWILVLRWLVLGLTPFVIGRAIVAWNRRWWKTPARIHYSLIVAALLVFLAFVFP